MFSKQLMLSMEEISILTGIPIDRVRALMNGELEPTGDEVLIMADVFKCDFKNLIIDVKNSSVERTDILFRRHGNDFSKADRMAVQEVLYMAECEEYLMSILDRAHAEKEFNSSTNGSFYKKHAEEAAKQLRLNMRYSEYSLNRNVFQDVREAGFHVFRRILDNSNISGVSIRHPIAGRCILINYNEDIYRQRFTLVHEAAHGIFDLTDKEDSYVSFKKWEKDNLAEIRANHFASNFLMPKEFLYNLPDSKIWDEDKILEWANRIEVNPEPLAIALCEAKLISKQQQSSFKKLKIPLGKKTDAELPVDLSVKTRQRKLQLLQRGLSDYYVKLCFDAYEKDLVSLSRIAEMLIIDEEDIHELIELYGVNF